MFLRNLTIFIALACATMAVANFALGRYFGAGLMLFCSLFNIFLARIQHNLARRTYGLK